MTSLTARVCNIENSQPGGAETKYGGAASLV